jgi:hypothetical protein
MAKPNRIRQVYGYTVCLVAVITALISLAGLINNAFDLSSPLASDSYGGSLTSFEAYKSTRSAPASQPAATDAVSDSVLHARYEVLREDRIVQRSFRARKGLVTDTVLLLVAIGLFATHWRWLRRLPDPED